MNPKSFTLAAQIKKPNYSYFILYDTDKHQYFSIIQNNAEISISQLLQSDQSEKQPPISFIPILPTSSIEASTLLKIQEEGEKYEGGPNSLKSLLDILFPSDQKNNLHFTSCEYAKAIYGISQAFYFASKNGFSISFSDIFFNNDKLPFVTFCTPLLENLSESKTTETDQLEYKNYIYKPEEARMALGHILYLLALVSFEDNPLNRKSNTDTKSEEKSFTDENGEDQNEANANINETETEKTPENKIETNENINETETEKTPEKENAEDQIEADENINETEMEETPEKAKPEEESESEKGPKLIFDPEKSLKVFNSIHHIIPAPFEIFPSFIDELIDRCMQPSVPFEWLINQISLNIEFIIEHGNDAEKIIDDPKTHRMIQSFKQYESKFPFNKLKSENIDEKSDSKDHNVDDDDDDDFDIPLRPPNAAPGTFRSFVIQEDLPYKMDPWIYCQTQSIIDLQGILMDTNESTLEENIEIFLGSIYRHDMQLINSFVHYIIIAAFHHPKSIKTIVALVKGIINACLSETDPQSNGAEYVDKLKEAILKMVPEKPASYGHFANASAPLNFLYECHKADIFTDNEIYQLIKSLTSLKENPGADNNDFYIRRVGLHLVAYFAPLLDQLDFKLLKAIVNYIRKYPFNFPRVFSSTYNVIYDIVAQEEQENEILNQDSKDIAATERWDPLEKMIYNPKGIREIIQRDDIESIRELAANPNFDINMRIPTSLFDSLIMAPQNPTILEYSAFHGAVKCFRYLITNGADPKLKDSSDKTVVHYAISGGSIEIVRICEQERLDFDGALEEAVRMYQFDIFEWLQGTKYQVLPMNNLQIGSIPLNAARTNNIRMILFSLENGLDINASDQYDSFPLEIASYFGYNDVIKLLLTSPNIEVNKVDRSGNSSLLTAINEEYTDTVRLLLSHRDIDITIKNNSGVHLFIIFILMHFI